MNMREQGLIEKFHVRRADGRDAPGEKHHGAEYFVLDMTDDPHAIPALLGYAGSCGRDYPLLAADLRARVAGMVTAASEFVTIPETTLPDGTVVPAFLAGKYLASRGPGDIPLSVADAAPWVNISYHEACEAAARAGLDMQRETQALAIAWDVSQQPENWSGGAVGEGVLRMGLHKGTVHAAQPGSYESPDPEENRWFVLSNGERICDVAGNAFSWIHDDVQGDENGLVAKGIAANSISLTTAPYGICEKGMGWRPDGARNWSGRALVRGGCWHSERLAGAFNLDFDWPGRRCDIVAVRCTKSL
ncbi:MAG: hypothetical protein H3C26_20250 [Rhodocyclaceae bacterium]|nr:hypothetical protein [Rhodocyclaceae bacterium]